MKDISLPEKKNSSIDSYIILFFHKVSSFSVSTKSLKKVIITAKMSDKEIQSKEIQNQLNKINILNENFIFPFNKKKYIKENKNFEMIFTVKDLEENSESNMIGKSNFNLNKIIFSEFLEFPDFWMPFENTHKSDKNNILGFLLASIIFVDKKNVKSLPYFWNEQNSNKDISLKIENIPCYLKINYEVISYSFFAAEFMDNKKYKLALDFSGNVMESEFFENGQIGVKFKFTFIKPIIYKNVKFYLIDEKNEKVAESSSDLAQVISFNKKAILSLNFYCQQNKELKCRLSYQLKKNMNKFDSPYFSTSEIPSEKITLFKKKLADVEEFELYFDLKFLADFQFEDYLVFRVSWGSQFSEIKINKDDNFLIKVNKRLILKEKFIFTFESLDFLPNAILFVENQKKEILFYTILKIDQIVLKRDDSPVEENFLFLKNYQTQNLPSLNQDQNNKQDFLLISFSCFLSDTALNLPFRELAIRDEIKETFYCLDIISFKYNYNIEENEEIDFSLTFLNKKGNSIKNQNLRNFNWIKKELLFKTNKKEPFILKMSFGKKENNLKNFLLYFIPEKNLEGIPQWKKFDGDDNIEILISCREFENESDFENYLKSKKTEKLSEIKHSLNNGEYFLQNIFFETRRFSLKLNILKIENFKQRINTLKLKNPYLLIDLSAFNSNENMANPKRKIFSNLTNSIKNGVFQDTVDVEEEINFEIDLPEDPRLLPSLNLKLCETLTTKQNSENHNFPEKVGELKNVLGNVQINICEFYLKQQILLFRKLCKLQQIIEENKDFYYRDILLPLLKGKLAKIEDTLLFTKNLKSYYNAKLIGDEENISVLSDLADRKKGNYFHDLKKNILNHLDKVKEERLNYDLKKIVGSNKTIQSSDLISDDIIFDSVNFVKKAKFDKVEGKTEIIKKKISDFKRIAFHDEKTAHYRYVLKCALEDSFYLDLHDFWDPIQILQNSNDFLISQNISEDENKKKKSISKNEQEELVMAKLWTGLEMFCKDDLLFNDQLLNLGLEPESLGLCKKLERADEPFEKLKLRLYLTNVFFERNYDENNLFVKIFLEDREIKELELKQKKKKKSDKLFFVEINECVEKLYNLRYCKNLKIVFVQKDKNFEKVKVIGETTINLDKRYLNKNWQNLVHKPIETRVLRSKDSEFYIGKINLWLEIFNSENQKNFPLINISRFSNPETYQIRLTLLNIQNASSLLSYKNAGSLQEIIVSSQFELFPFPLVGEEKWKTQYSDNLHVSKNAKSIDVNSRMVWDFTIDGYKQNLDCLLNLMIHNKSSDKIFVRKIDFSNELIESVKKSQRTAMRAKKEKIEEEIVLEVFLKSEDNDDLIEVDSAQIKFKLEICPENYVKKFPVNKGRKNPNNYPVLLTPDNLKPTCSCVNGITNNLVFFNLVVFFVSFLAVLGGCYIFTHFLLK